MTVGQFRDALLSIDEDEVLFGIGYSIDGAGERYHITTNEKEHIIKIGRWVEMGYECSVCGNKTNEMLDYCPCCGAFMV